MKILPIALAALLAGCGTVVETGSVDAIDAAPADQPDAAPATGELTVVVTVQGAPYVGALVLYNRPDGTHAGEMLADEDGLAVISEMPVGGGVTVLFPGRSRAHQLWSVLGTAPGDVIRFNDTQEPEPSPAPIGQMDVTLPGGDAAYVLDFPCQPTRITGNSADVLAAEVLPGCDPNDLHVAVYQIDSPTNAAGARAAGSVNSPLKLPDGSPLEVQANAVGELGTVTATIPAFPEARLEDLLFAPRFGDRPSPPPIGPAGGMPTLQSAASIEASRRFVPDFYDKIAVASHIIANNGGAEFVSGAVTPGSFGPETPAAADLTLVMPPIGDITLVSEEPLVVSGTASSVFECGDSGPAEVQHAFAFRALDGQGATGWSVLAPGPGGGEVRFPELPPSVKSLFWRPSWNLRNVGYGVSAHTESSYDDIRNGPAITGYPIIPGLVGPVGDRSCSVRQGIQID